MAEITGRNSLRLYIGGYVLVVLAKGKWEPAPPKSQHKLPEPLHQESHQAYATRYLKLLRTPDKSLEMYQWKDKRRWVGESVSDILAILRCGDDLLTHECRKMTINELEKENY